MESTGCRKTYVSVNVDQKRCVYPRYIRWENGLVFLLIGSSINAAPPLKRWAMVEYDTLCGFSVLQTEIL